MIRYIYDIYFLLKWRSRIKRDVEAIYVLDYAKSFYKRKGTWQRKQFAKIIREIRKEKPYQVIDFSEAEKLFKSQESRFNFREVQEGSFVTKDKEQCAYRGTRFSHYFIDNDNRKGVFRVGGWQDSWERYEITDYKGYDAYGLRIRKDIIFYDGDLPYTFSVFILEKSGEEIDKEEFERQKQEVINRILK